MEIEIERSRESVETTAPEVSPSEANTELSCDVLISGNSTD